jgi:hypothetical protein
VRVLASVLRGREPLPGGLLTDAERGANFRPALPGRARLLHEVPLELVERPCDPGRLAKPAERLALQLGGQTQLRAPSAPDNTQLLPSHHTLPVERQETLTVMLPDRVHDGRADRYRQFMAAAVTEATITCPECGAETREDMPTNACQFFYTCPACSARLRPLAGDCCVFCSYADQVCPPKQTGNDACC